MPFRDDPRIDRLETLAARISRMHHSSKAVFQRQRGNLKREDRELIEDYQRAYADVLALLKELRNER
jgi:hypothetical protein